MVSPDLPPRRLGTPPPIPPVEPPPLPPEALEASEASFEILKAETEHLTIAAANIAKAEIKPGAYEGPSQDAYAIFPETEEVMVNDGVGGERAGDLAARLACDRWPQTVQEEKKSLKRLKPSALDLLWQHIMIEGQPLILPNLIEQAGAHDRAQEDAEGFPRGSVTTKEKQYRDAREQALTIARAQFAKMEDPPEEVKLEAMARFRALREVSGAIRRAAEENPDERKGMATTSSGMKIMEVGGERWGIFWTVGDSQALIESTDGTTLEQAAPSDGGLEMHIQLGLITADQARDLTNPIVRQLRFQICNQALGQETDIMPHIMVRKLRPGQRLRLASDGLTDSFLDEDPQDTILDRSEGATLARGTRRAVRGAIEGFHTGKGKGTDDVTVVDIEVKSLSSERKINAEMDWAIWVSEVLREMGVGGAEEDRIIRELNEGVIRHNIIKQALSEIALLQNDREVSSEEAAGVVKRYIGERIEHLRSPDLRTGERAA